MSVFDWKNGQPSIFAPLQKDARMVRSGPPEDAPIRTRRAISEKPKTDWPKRNTVTLSQRIDLAAARDFRLAGNSWTACAVKFGCTAKTIIRAMKVHYPEVIGVRAVPGSHRTDLSNEMIAKQIKAGASVRQIAKQYGVAHSTIFYRLQSMGTKQQDKTRVPIDDVAIAREIMAGDSVRAVAIRRGLSRSTVQRRLMKTKHGREALNEVRRREILRCNAGHPFGSVHILTRAEIEHSNNIKGARL